MPQNRESINSILDTAWSPVARLRLLSGGISPNNLLEEADNVAGQKCCIACGNCVDACPVVLREKGKVDLQAERTSLHLETVVEDSCLRCFRCVQQCPQVDRDLKVFATRHRITEKLVHWWMAAAYFLTMFTGLALNHFRDMWSDTFIMLISIAHKSGAVMWLLSPFLFYYFDRYHFKRMVQAVFSFGRGDWAWWAKAIRNRWAKDKRPFQGEYNSGQKVWYLVVFGTMTVLGITGIVRWFWEEQLDPTVLGLFILIHIIAALTVDISFAFHLGRKFLSRALAWFRIIFDCEKSDAKSENIFPEEAGQSYKGIKLITNQKSQKKSA